MSNLVKSVSYVLKEIQAILQDDRASSGWVTCLIAGRWVQAKVYNEPSTYGINNGRVSKLVISKSCMRDAKKNFLDQMDYNYDRGLDFSNLPPEDVEVVVAALEKLPPANLQAEAV